jgi:PAS domain S-box-containing protein
MKYVGPRIESMLGYPATAWTNDPRFWCRVLHAEDRERVVETDRAAIEEGRDLDIEYRTVHRDGHVVWVHDTATIIRDVDGRPIAPRDSSSTFRRDTRRRSVWPRPR